MCFCCDVSPEECLTLRALNEEARERAAGAQSITIPREHYELLKEAAEDWAKSRIESSSIHFGFIGYESIDGHFHACRECARESTLEDSASIRHTANCKAARILGLEREEG